MVLSEVQALLELIERANAWLTVAVERSKRKRAQTAARVLFDAGILVAAMRTYDNTYRRVLRRIRLLQPGASEEERRQIVEELMSFNEAYVISPHIHQACASLEGEMAHAEQPCELQTLLDSARNFRKHTERPIEGAKGQFSLQHSVIGVLLNAETEQELQSAAEFAEEQLRFLSLELLEGADRAFGRLRQRIVNEHGLPTPNWAIQLPASRSGVVPR